MKERLNLGIDARIGIGTGHRVLIRRSGLVDEKQTAGRGKMRERIHDGQIDGVGTLASPHDHHGKRFSFFRFRFPQFQDLPPDRIAGKTDFIRIDPPGRIFKTDIDPDEPAERAVDW